MVARGPSKWSIWLQCQNSTLYTSNGSGRERLSTFISRSTSFTLCKMFLRASERTTVADTCPPAAATPAVVLLLLLLRSLAPLVSRSKFFFSAFVFPFSVLFILFLFSFSMFFMSFFHFPRVEALASGLILPTLSHLGGPFYVCLFNEFRRGRLGECYRQTGHRVPCPVSVCVAVGVKFASVVRGVSKSRVLLLLLLRPVAPLVSRSMSSFHSFFSLSRIFSSFHCFILHVFFFFFFCHRFFFATFRFLAFFIFFYKKILLGFSHIPCLHDDLTNTRHETQPHKNRVGALIQSHPGDLIPPVETSTVYGCLVRQGGCGWPDSTTDRQATGRNHCADSGQTLTW